MTYPARIKAMFAKAISTWRSFGQIAPLALGFAAGLAVTHVL